MKTKTIPTFFIGIFLICFAACTSKEGKLLSLANKLINDNNFDSALLVIDKAIEINPDYTVAYLEKCKIYILQNNREFAEQCLQKALQSSEDDYMGSSFFEVGNLYYEQRNFKNAISCYKEAIKNGEEYSHSYALTSDPSPGAETKWYRSYSFYFFALGNAYANAGKCTDAYKSFNAAIGVANKGLRSRDLMQEGVDLVFSGENSDRVDYREYVGAFFYNRGLISKLLGKNAEANEDIKAAKELNYINGLVLNVNNIQCN